MKKITFLLALFAISFGFSQELVTNGDFETGMAAPWTGNAANVVDDGSTMNYINQANVTVAGNSFDVNLSQDINLVSGNAYRLTFDAYTDATTGSRTMVVGLGQNAPPWSAKTTTVTLTSTSQNFTFDTIIDYGDAVTDRVLFDMGAATGFVFLDNVSVVQITNTCNNMVQDGDETGVDCGGSLCPPCTVPPTIAPTSPPARPAADVISIYGEAYGAEIGLSNVPWDDPTNFTEQTIDGNKVLRIDFDTFMGSNLGSVVDATDFTHFHMDYWVADFWTTGQVFNLKWSNHAGGAGETNAGEYNIALPGDSSLNQTWVSLDTPLTDWTAGISPRADLTQYLITVAGLIGEAYIDNVYFHKNTLSTEEFADNDFRVFPNPSNNVWNISANNTINSVAVYDILGKQVLSLQPNSNEVSINTSSFRSGVYFAKIKGVSGSKTVKLIRE